MVNRDAAYRRMLRWYPRRWRDTHGEALLGALLDAAEAEGRDHPSPAERRSSALHGLSARLDERFALISAAAATATAAVMLIAFTMGAQGLSFMAQPFVPWFTALAVIALLRHRAGLQDSLALSSLAATTLAFALGATTMLSWSLTFAAADAGIPGTWFSQSLLLWLSAAWLTGATAVALVALGLLKSLRIHPFVRLITSIVGGLVAAPLIAVSVVNPLMAALTAAAVLVLVVLLRRPSSQTTPHISEPASLAAAAPTPPALRSRSRRHTARALAWLALLVSLLGLAYALTGSTWTSGGLDSTATMRLGMAAMTFAGAILLVAVAVIATARRSGPRRGIPFTLLALGLVLAAVGNIVGTSAEPTNPASLAAAAMIAAGLGLLIGFSRRGTTAGRWVIAAAAALLTAPLTALLLPALVFLVPLFAVGFAVWGTRAVSPRDFVALPQPSRAQL